MDKIFPPKDVPAIAIPLTVDGSGDADRKAPSVAACSCPICTRKSDSLHGSCDHRLNASEDSVLYAHPEECYPDVPRTITPASSINHSNWSAFPDESLIDIAVSSLSTPTVAGPDSTQTDAPPSLHTSASSLRDTTQPLSLPGSGSSSARIFDHPLSSQSSLSVPASFEAFLTPRAAPLPPPASPTSTTTPNNMSMTWVPGLPFLRRTEERNKEMFPCQICLEDEAYDDAVVIQACGHMFGRECMRNYILARLDERRFPIPCPCCSVDETGATQAVVTSGIATQVDLSDADCRRWDELEFQAHAVLFECGRCNQSHTIDRRKIVKEKRKKKVYCLTAGCDGVWCRQCHTELAPGAKHKCEGRRELKLLMKQEGWKNCPGCNIPVQKSSGCNHIACSAPGCNTHFCYRCETILVRSVFGSEIHAAVSSHFRRRFYFWRCSQFHDPSLFVRIITGQWSRT